MKNQTILKQFSGQTEEHIVLGILPDGIAKPVHRDIVAPFLNLQARAKSAGFDLQIASGFRDRERQLSIWCAKASGQRPVLGCEGQVLDITLLSEQQLLFALLRWSALPGTSRHHWGTDIDVYDAAAVGVDYRVQLTAQEVVDDGVFGPLHRWLDTNMASSGWFRPYQVDRGGIAVERWHLSYAPVARQYHNALDSQHMLAQLEQLNLPLFGKIKANWQQIVSRYIEVPLENYPL